LDVLTFRSTTLRFCRFLNARWPATGGTASFAVTDLIVLFPDDSDDGPIAEAGSDGT
jgi:hypothetical protein